MYLRSHATDVNKTKLKAGRRARPKTTPIARPWRRFSQRKALPTIQQLPAHISSQTTNSRFWISIFPSPWRDMVFDIQGTSSKESQQLLPFDSPAFAESRVQLLPSTSQLAHLSRQTAPNLSPRTTPSTSAPGHAISEGSRTHPQEGRSSSPFRTASAVDAGHTVDTPTKTTTNWDMHGMRCRYSNPLRDPGEAKQRAQPAARRGITHRPRSTVPSPWALRVFSGSNA